MSDKKAGIVLQNKLADVLSGLLPEELSPRLELQILIDPASLLSNVAALDNNNNNNIVPPNNNNNNNV